MRYKIAANITCPGSADTLIIWVSAKAGRPAEPGQVMLAAILYRIFTTRLGSLYMTPPPDLSKVPMLLLDGQTYAPGKGGNTIIVPLLPGEHSFELKNIFQPPIFRNWQTWQSD